MFGKKSTEKTIREEALEVFHKGISMFNDALEYLNQGLVLSNEHMERNDDEIIKMEAEFKRKKSVLVEENKELIALAAKNSKVANNIKNILGE